MEAATPLRKPQVSATGGRLTIRDLVVEDECAVRVVREHRQAGDDPAKTVADAIEIGARVLDREQAAANAEYVRTEFEKTAKELDVAFTDKARKVAEHFGDKVDQVFAPDDGQLAKELEKLFSDGSTASVQNRVRELVGEALARSREDLVRQFSSADDRNPLADFKASTVRQLERANAAQLALVERMAELEKQLQSLHAEKEKLERLDEERERGTAKGRSYEDRVAEGIEALAVPLGDDAEAVGDVKGATGKTGDVVVRIGACDGPARGRIVFEAKDRRLSRPKALEELDRALAQRDADFAVLVVPGDDELPARMQPLREYNGDKLIVTYDPDEGSPLALEVGYRLARARVLMSRGSADGIDAGALRDTVERARTSLDEVRNVKSSLTGATNQIEAARRIVDALSDRVRSQLDEIERLIGAGEASDGDDQAALDV